MRAKTTSGCQVGAGRRRLRAQQGRAGDRCRPRCGAEGEHSFPVKQSLRNLNGSLHLFTGITAIMHIVHKETVEGVAGHLTIADCIPR
jgi:hypothetical protein